MKTKLSSLSIFFPAYNEEGNIVAQVKAALAVAPKVAKQYEILIINDGSKDATKALGQKLEKRYKFVRLVNQRNKGYGGAVKRGFREAKHDWIFFTDADLQFDMSELPLLVTQSPKQDLVLGFRIDRADGWKRVLLARMLKIWNRTFLGFPSGIRDIDCAFKLIRRDVIRSIEPLISDGAMVSTEFLLKAHRAGFHNTQVGVHHYNRQVGQPTGSNRKVIFRAIFDTFLLQKELIKSRPSSSFRYWLTDKSLSLPMTAVQLISSVYSRYN